MSTLPQQQTIVQYVANVSQFQYTFAFYAPLPSDINVYYQAPNVAPIPSSDLLILNVGYTVTYNSDPTTGGYITLLFTPTSGYLLTINRNVIATLTTNFGSAQTLNGTTLDNAFQRLLLLIQQNQNYILERNLSYVINTYLPNATPYTQLPPLAQNQIWQGSGSGIVAATLSTTPDWSTLQSLLANNSPGTAGANLVGYYDNVNDIATTVNAFLANLPTFLQNYFVQPGMMIEYAGGTVLAGYLKCDGSAVSRTTYANLFAAIGTTWGVGNGTTTFNLPNYQRATSIGSGGTQPSGSPVGTTVGSTGGQETVNAANLPGHTHPLVTNPTIKVSLSGSGSVTTVQTTSSNFPQNGALLTGGTTDANTAVVNMSIMQPTNVVTKLIKY